MTSSVDEQSQVHNRLLALAGHENPYLFLSYAGSYLIAAPDDDRVRAQAIRLFVQKGLFSVAEEFARACPPSSPVYGQLQTFAAQFADRRTDLLDWNQTDARFAANLQVLRRRGGAAATLADRIEQLWPSEMPPGLTLHRANDGNWQVRCCRSDGHRIWLPALQDFLNHTEAIAHEECFQGNFVSPLLLDGVGTGLLVPRLWTATHHTYLTYSAAIYLVEPNVRALALAMRLHDWTAALADERFMLFTGPSAWTDWLETLMADLGLAEPGQVVHLARWPGDRDYPADECREQLKQRRKSITHQERDRAEAVYASTDRSAWARRYASANGANGDDPLRVLCMTSRHTTFLQHSMRDLIAAMQRAQLRTELLIEQRDYTVLSGPVCLRRFAEFKPDLAIVIDHHRHEMPERFASNVPFLCWIQDELPSLYAADAGPKLGPLDFTMGFGRDICVSQFGYPAERFMPCPIVVEPAKLAPEPGCSAVEPELQCDVSYVGHQAETPADLHARIRSQLQSPLTEFLDAFYEEMMPRMQGEQFHGAFDLRGMIREIEARTSIEMQNLESFNRLLGLYVRPLADRVLRHATLNWVADWAEQTGRSFHLYGLGWENHPRLGKFGRGVARHGPHLGAILRSAAINLHFGLNLSMHQRVLEALAAGGFLLVREHPHDFYPAWMPELCEWIRGRGLPTPARVQLVDLPASLAQQVRDALMRMGHADTSFIQVTREQLDEATPAHAAERRQHYAAEAFPEFSRITFDSSESFARQADRYIEAPDARAEVARQMQDVVLGQFTYDALVRAMITFVSGGLGAIVGD